jgi:hypothetical protein
MKLLWIFSVILISGIAVVSRTSTARAEWSPSALRWAERFGDGPVLFDSEAATVWGAVNAERYQPYRIRYEDWELPSKEFQTRALPVLAAPRKGGQDYLIAPLMIILPGVFSSADSAGSLRLLRLFSARGFHAVAIANAWSSQYLAHLPLANPGDMEDEAKIVLRAIRSIIHKIGKQNIAGVYLAGESYGAFLGAITANIDAFSPEPVIDQQITLMSPPLQMGLAIQNLDRGIDQTQALYENECYGNWETFSFAWELWFAESEASFSPELKKCCPALVMNTFQGSLRESAELMNETKELGLVPSPEIDPEAYLAWRRSLRFQSFEETFTPENLGKIWGPQGSLAFWLSTTPLSYRKRIQVISAEDDFLNVGASWQQPGVVGPKSLILLPWGGHTGFEGLSAFDQLLKIVF